MFFGNVEDVVEGDDADQAAMTVDDGKDRAVVLAKDLDGCFLIVGGVQADEAVVADIRDIGVQGREQDLADPQVVNQAIVRRSPRK